MEKYQPASLLFIDDDKIDTGVIFLTTQQLNRQK
jgi:hypothetical protein